jgi:hypothetical protein
MAADPDLILTSRRLEGARAVRRFAGPPIDVILIDRDRPDALKGAIGRLCQIWGGAKFPLIPARRGGIVAKSWFAVQQMPLVHVFKGSVRTDDEVAKGGDGLPAWTANSLLALLARQPDRVRGHIQVSLPSSDSPWYEAYLGALGWLPELPEKEVLDTTWLIPQVRFEDIVDVGRETVEKPGADDLLERLSGERGQPPALATLWHLASSPVARKTRMKGELPDPRALPRIAGPRIVVVYRPGSVEDVCLLWTLRSIHGATDGLPLGAPTTDDSWESAFVEERRIRVTPFQRPLVVLTSCSVPYADLRAIAARHLGWVVAPYSKLLQVPYPPARPSSGVAVFSAGSAVVSALASSDEELLSRMPATMPHVEVRFELQERALPPIRSLTHESSSEGFANGGYELTHRRDEDMRRIEWPSGWKVLEAAVSDHGLRARPSAPGRAALAVLESMGGLESVDYLLSRDVLDALYELGELRGISWFRARERDLRRLKYVSHEERARLIAAIETAARHRTEDDIGSRGADGFRAAFGGKRALAQRWVAWAETAGLLVRGVGLRCDRCAARQWRGVGELTSGMICRSCGQRMSHPFPSDHLSFAYRASQPLLSALEDDALPHLLAIRWFAHLLDPWPEPRSVLFGAHPGVELLEVDGTVIAEIDTLLLMADGSLVPGEIKRSGRGLTRDDLDMLDVVARRLESPWSFVATPDLAVNCDPIWRKARRTRGRARLVITGDRLLEPVVHWVLGDDPFAWPSAQPSARKRLQIDFPTYVESRFDWDKNERIPGRISRESD